MVVDLYTPNKTDAVSYFAGSADIPKRWAIASISFGATEEPYIQEWVVGPLPLNDQAIFYPDTFGTHTDEAKIRIYDMDDSSGFVYEKAMEMDDILRDLLKSKSKLDTCPIGCELMMQPTLLLSVWPPISDMSRPDV
jgi:primary-amine oxidase